MPYPVFQRNDYVDSTESVEALLESVKELLINCIAAKDTRIQELTAENENLRAEIEKAAEAAK